MTTSDARKRNAEAVVFTLPDGQPAREFTHPADAGWINPPRFTSPDDVFTQEDDPMPDPIDHRAEAERLLSEAGGNVSMMTTIGFNTTANTHALLAIHDLLRERLPERTEVKVAPFDPDLITRNLEALKHAVSKPMREHGGCCEAAEVTEGGGFTALMEHFGIKPAPADDLPGEPVEPGDLRAGDRVEFKWGDERITSTLVSVHDVLRSNVPASSGYTPNVVWDGEWAGGVSDVRLIERAPREDEDPDEALAMDLYHASLKIPPVSEIGPTAWDDATRQEWLDVARAAREHIEAEQESRERTVVDEWDDMLARAEKAERALGNATQRVLALTAERDKWNTLAHEADRNAKRQHDRAEKAETERDEWREIAARYADGRDKWQAKWRESDEARERAEADLADERDRHDATITERDALRDDLADATRQRDEYATQAERWQACHAALREDVEQERRGSGCRHIGVEAILARDDERAAKGDQR